MQPNTLHLHNNLGQHVPDKSLVGPGQSHSRERVSTSPKSPLGPSFRFSSSPSSSSSSPTMPRKHKAMPLAHSVSDSAVVFPSPTPSALAKGKLPVVNVPQLIDQLGTVQEREDFIYELLSTMPRSQLSSLQRRIAPLLQFDVVGSLPTEVALQIFSHLPPHTLLTCMLVSRRWNVLANDQSLWKALCYAQGWEWRHSMLNNDGIAGGSAAAFPTKSGALGMSGQIEDEDEGMGDSDDDGRAPAGTDEDSFMADEFDSGFASGSVSMLQPLSSSSSSNPLGVMSSPSGSRTKPRNAIYMPRLRTRSLHRSRRSTLVTAPPSPFSSRSPSSAHPTKSDYKLLYRTHTHLRNRFLTSSYRLSVIQTRGSPPNGHANMIYCVQLYTYPATNQQVIFTGSRDRTIREWNLRTGEVERVFEGVHTESVLSLCVRKGWMVSAGSDWRVVLWRLDKRHSGKGKNAEGHGAVKVLRDHADSVLCVRFDDERLVSCSKDRTVRIYTFPDLELLHVLGGHRAAVNAISLSKNFVVSGSGDRSMNVWDVKTGKLIRTFEDHHTRGIASIDFKPPYIVSGSSDKHIRLIDMNTSQGWSTSPEYDTAPLGLGISGLGLGLTPLGPTHAPFLPPQLYPPQYTQYLYGGASDACGSSVSTAGSGAAPSLCQSCGSAVAHPPNSYPTTSILTSGPSGDGSSIDPTISPVSSDSTLLTPASNAGSSFSVSASTSTSTIPLSAPAPAPSLPMPFLYTHSYPHSHLPLHPRFPYHHYAHTFYAHPYALSRRISTSNSTHPPHNNNITSSTTQADHNHTHAHAHNTTIFPLHHTDLVRSVALGPDFIVTGSYDLSVKIWDRMSGILVADLTGGHTGKIFCVAADRTKVVSCGEDLRICVWDFSGGVEGVGWMKNEW